MERNLISLWIFYLILAVAFALFMPLLGFIVFLIGSCIVMYDLVRNSLTTYKVGETT